MHSFLDSFDTKLAESTDEMPMAAGNDSVPTVLVCSSHTSTTFQNDTCAKT